MSASTLCFSAASPSPFQKKARLAAAAARAQRAKVRAAASRAGPRPPAQRPLYALLCSRRSCARCRGSVARIGDSCSRSCSPSANQQQHQFTPAPPRLPPPGRPLSQPVRLAPWSQPEPRGWCPGNWETSSTAHCLALARRSNPPSPPWPPSRDPRTSGSSAPPSPVQPPGKGPADTPCANTHPRALPPIAAIAQVYPRSHECPGL